MTPLHSYGEFDFEIDEETLISLLDNNNYDSNGMCFIKNRERGSNEFSSCTVREFNHTQMEVSNGGA